MTTILDVEPRKRARRKAARHDTARDAEQLGYHCVLLAMAAGEAATPDTLLAAARSAPRGEAEAHSPCSCRPCAALLIAAEARVPHACFRPLAAFFLEELPSWGCLRRAAAEECLARDLGA